MVLDDVFAKTPPAPLKNTQVWGMAQPLDRVASFIADMVLFVPVSSLLTAVFRKGLLQAQITSNQDQYSTMLFACVGACVILFIAYQSFCHFYWGATLGQRFLGLKVVSVWFEGKKPSRKNALIRALVLICEFCCLGLPLLAIFSNERRRPWHDRMADTIVLAHRSYAKSPLIGEVSIAAGLQTAVLIFVALMGLVSWQSWYQITGSSGLKMAQELESENVLCPDVGDALEDWPKARGQKEISRLQVALSLYSASSISDDCLESEADFAIWHNGANEDKALAYLSKALVHENEPQLFSSYSDKVCADDNAKESSRDLCRTLHLATDENSAAGLDNDLIRWTPQEDFSRLWLAKHWLRTHRYDRVLALLQSWEPRKDLGFFVTSLRAQALWQTGQVDQAHLIFTTSLDQFSQNQRTEMARWFCAADSVDGCTPQAVSSCQALLDSVEKRKDVQVSSLEVAEVLVRGEQCVHSAHADWSVLKSDMKVADGLSYIHALELVQAGQKQKAENELRALLEKVDEDNPFFYPAQSKLAELEKLADDFNEIKQSWMHGSGEVDESWAVLGHRLFAHYVSQHNPAAALQVGELLQSIEPFNTNLSKSLVVLAFHSGQIDQARKFLTQAQFVPSLASENLSSRTPASAQMATSEFDEIAAHLQSEIMFEHGRREKADVSP